MDSHVVIFVFMLCLKRTSIAIGSVTVSYTVWFRLLCGYILADLSDWVDLSTLGVLNFFLFWWNHLPFLESFCGIPIRAVYENSRDQMADRARSRTPP